MLHQPDGLAFGGPRRHPAMDTERLGELGTDRVHRVERGQCVLEDDRQFGSGDLAALAFARRRQVGVPEHHRAVGDIRDRVQEPDQGLGGHGLATSGLAQQGQRLAAAGDKRDVVDGPHHPGGGAQVDGQVGDVQGDPLVGGGRAGIGDGWCAHATAFREENRRRRARGTVRRQRWPGSVAIRAHAARIVADTVVTTMARPGKNDSHHAVCK